MGFKAMKMGWDICSSPPWVPFYPYTMFQNPISWPSHKKCRKTIITQKVLVTQSSNIVHCDQPYPKTYMCRFGSLCEHFFPVQIDVFFFSFLSGGVQENSQNFTFCWFWLGKMHQNGLSGAYLGFEACWIQCCRFQVSVISGSWKITISGKNFTFCWFWLGKMHWNCLSGMYLGFKACWIQWHLLQVSTDKWFMKNHNFRRHIAENGVQSHENGMGHMQQSSLGPILPLHHVSEPNILTFP